MQRLRRIAFALLLCLFVAACGRPADPKEAAQQFFNLVAAGNTDQAHSGAAFAFQAEQNPRVFEQAAKEQGLISAQGVELERLDSDEKMTKFNAVVNTAKGEKQAYILTLQKESGDWKVFSLKTPRSPETGLREHQFSLVGKGAAFNDALSQPMPDEATIKQLVGETLGMFNNAVTGKSFTEFYGNVSAAWQAQLTERQLERAFQPFVDQGVNLSGALKLEPVLDPPPQITTEGLLVVAGHYPSKPYHVEFALKYIYELPSWKLFGIDVNLRKPKE
ncbi:MAG: hypothetical protein EOP84_33670 [Verrucomicrobiaceae bacterium]|nr:MAG: hypothetical protein EOP84_33670 [Verrucomicrobiaceae bacterium]